MKLLGVEKIEEELTWLYSEWSLTYRVGWHQICAAVALIWEYTEAPELKMGDAYEESFPEVKNTEEIMNLEESGWLGVRGKSKILEVPVQITFYNQTDHVKVSVLSVNEEFSEADYRKFNLSMCQFMDSAEIAMYS
ncbi:MAG: hypothetical protein K6G81_07940 [Lachnospiraceae bacterium]|nr:hypothetical protein [Lachnospiraceae bacterium]